MDQQTIDRIVGGFNEPLPEVIEQMAEKTGLPKNYIYGDLESAYQDITSGDEGRISYARARYDHWRDVFRSLD